ncbi:MAG: GNAT family N-acetyltransferase [Steroidobacteraceae bacterium]
MADAPILRAIAPGDDAAIAHVIRTVMPEFGAEGPGYAINDAEVATMSSAYGAPRHRYYVIELDGTVMGGAGIAPLAGADQDTCELRKMYFLPRLRGLGLGSKLLQTCLDAARELHYQRCYLETLARMDAAQALYRKFGFRRIAAPRGATGHFSCDAWYELELTPRSG